ncbi:hypothetical protein [Thermoanaerobacterium xylanolyticum]|nr:hypothetical protein [Thermoanaerobacterium xylanolyticum]
MAFYVNELIAKEIKESDEIVKDYDIDTEKGTKQKLKREKKSV